MVVDIKIVVLICFLFIGIFIHQESTLRKILVSYNETRKILNCYVEEYGFNEKLVEKKLK
jgi:hypothetical protein